VTSLVTDQGIIHYEAKGRGRPVILLHGWMETWAVWRQTIEELSKEFRTYALDFWGFGDSDSVKGNTFTVDHYVEMVNQFIDKLGIIKAPLIGHSMGGTVSLSTAMRYPEKIVKVVVIGSPIYGSSLNVLLKLSGVSYLADLLFRLPPVLDFFTLLVSQLSTRNGLKLYRFVKSEHTQLTMQSFFQSIGTLRKTDLRPRLGEVRSPTMGIYGKWDFIVHPNQGKALQKGVPNSKVLMYANSGHIPMMDAPDRLIRDVREFLVTKHL
jgi:pimeloyl-ACP methyl ester carboxylesterase